MTQLFAKTVTKVGLSPTTRLPANTDRSRLLRLAHRGAEVCHKHRARLLAQICDTLAATLIDLGIAESRAYQAERALAVARIRIDELERGMIVDAANHHDDDKESFETPTVRRDSSAMIRALRGGG